MRDICGESHPEQPGLTCFKGPHPFGHHVAKDETAWPGLPYPDTRKHGSSRVSAIIGSIGPRGRTVGPPRPTRASDPITSHQAAASTSIERLRKSQQQVLQLFVDHGSMCDEVLLEVAAEQRIQQSVSGLRTRRKELVTSGLLRDTGERQKTAAGRDTVVWGLASGPV